MDKRSTQTVLPLHIEPKEIKETIKQHWNVTFARQGKISVVGKRIMALVLGQIHENDMKLKPYYQMKVSDVVKAAELKGRSAYNEIKKSLDELARQVWSLEDPNREVYKPKQLINTSTIQEREGFEYGYNEGVITVVLNPALEPYFLNLAHYSTYHLKHYMHFKSWYSMRMWEILSAYRDQPKYHVSLDEFRKLMDCEKKYKSVHLLIRYTLSEPLEELKGTDLEFTVVKKYADFSGRGRPPVVGLEFHFVKPRKADPEQRWEKLVNHSVAHGNMANTLLDEFQVSKAHILKLFNVLPIKDIVTEVKGFRERLKDGKDPVKDVAKFFNGAVLNIVKQHPKNSN